ncbi:MAG: phage/plasmid primase, P4 family [bacterium]|nr:phage/plasmid primase, P4 family [bacterium]
MQDSPTPSDNGRDTAAKRDASYRCLLAKLPLSPDHRDALKHRGLSDADIDAGIYKTLPASGRGGAVKQVAAELGQDFATVPGFVMGERGPRIAAPAGLLVPVLDLAGRVVALKVRADNPKPDASKYLYLSSAKYGGPGPGSPAHVPAGVCGPVELARITEGELKADVAFRLTGVPTISFPGVASWRVVLPVLEELRTQTVRVAFDADATTNKSVAKPLLECIEELQDRGYSVEVERWQVEQGKGIDDVLAAGHASDIAILAGAEALAAAVEIAGAAGAGIEAEPGIDGLNEETDDPHRLARACIARNALEDGTNCLRYWRDEWQRWDGKAYRSVPNKEMRTEITQLAKAEFNTENRADVQHYIAEKIRGNSENDEGPRKCRKVTTNLVSNVANALASECVLSGDVQQPTWLDTDGPFPADEVLVTASGLLHLPGLTSGKPCLLPLTPAFFSGNALRYEFDPKAECPEWLRFLASLWSDDQPSIDTLSEWFGYCLLPDTRHHKLLMLIGPPRSGKGTIARVLRAVIGEQNLASPTLASLAGPFGLQPLLNKLVALVADARLSGRTDAIAVVERLLSITGEDPQDVARKHMTTLAGIKLPVRFVLMSNELPNMRDASGALMSRVLLLRLTRSFQGKEDKTLRERLLLELPGILNWSILGWQRLQERGAFMQPDSGLELLDDLTDLASPVGAFVRDRCIIGPEFTTGLDKLFDEWRAWCELHGRDHGGREVFGKNLRAAVTGLNRRRPRRGDADSDVRKTAYEGIGLRSANEPGTRWDTTQSYAREGL